MMDRTQIIADTAADRRQAAEAESRREESWRNEASGLYASWNSWGERSPFALGATGRW
ncbi:hypothetical protein [Teichococcus rhizosphaerae]|uniref:hypothetical protein n=1 Tax=Teichococcus rhizosphaerae TaxID=1335062 RepID=UPI00159BEF5E|nr:hypothetical protein [Pseudoroseomonas rhizosphaerae]